MNEELQLAVHLGEREAFGTLYGMYAPDVYQRALGILGRREDARLVVKKVFTQVYRALLQASAPMDLESYIDYLLRKALSTGSYAQQPSVEAAASPAAASSKTAASSARPASRPGGRAPVLLNSGLDDEDDEEIWTDGKPDRRFGKILSLFTAVALLLILLWGLTGILMDFGIIPENGLWGSFAWFNEHVFSLFDFV